MRKTYQVEKRCDNQSKTKPPVGTPQNPPNDLKEEKVRLELGTKTNNNCII